MMYSPNVQLTKWAFPAVALIIGLFWYKRRRIHRADPGGITQSDHQDKIIPSYTEQADMNLYDSSIREIDESPTSCYTQQEEPARVSRKVSESMDIPVRKSSSQSFSCHSNTDVGPMNKLDVQLGSNPSTSYLETVARRRSASSFDFEFASNVMRVSEDVDEESKCAEQCEVKLSEQKDATDEYNYEKDRQLDEKHPDGAVETEGKAAYERDSANHSPVSGVLEDSITDEARSEGSTDSGKGGSINGCRKNLVPASYKFAIPQSLVGRLIGRHGNFLHSIRTKTEVLIYVSNDPIRSNQKVCCIEGSVEGINVALDMIRKKFPEKRYPQVTLAEISTPEIMPVVPQCSRLFLVDGVNNDIVVSHIVRPNWLFVQLPTHPTYPSLRLLDANMTYTYNAIQPSEPCLLEKGMLYAANWYDTWVRVSMEKLDPLGEKHKMRLLDHGGYYEFSNLQIRDIRPEHLTLPFQAIEIFLANIRPKNDVWLDEAYHVIAQICFGIVGQAQIECYVNSNVYTNVYFNIPKYGVISLADELVARGYAETVALQSTISETAVQLFQESNFS